METVIGSVVGVLVWLLANVVYADKRRRSVRGFARLVAFWLGLPVSVLTMVFVGEGSQPTLEPPPDDDDALLAEVRRDRVENIQPPDGESRGDTTEEAP